MSTCLITGGTGTFGISYVLKALTSAWHRKIIVYSRDEFKQINMFEFLCAKFTGLVQYKNVSNLSAKINGVDIRFFIGDVQNKDRLLVATRNVDVVIHAAALKHVPVCEYNPIEATSVNINGTINVAAACGENGVKIAVALGTDKSVDPINIYGATKLCLEKVFLGSSRYYHDTNYSIVRYGNIIGSRGSVIFNLMDKNKKQFAITDPEMTRFWLTIDDAVNLVRSSINSSKSGDIFVPIMKSLSVESLFKYLRPDVQAKIIGCRSGEKKHEKMINDYDIKRTYCVDSKHLVISEDQYWKSSCDLFDMEQYSSDRVQRFEKQEFLDLCAGSIINEIYEDRKLIIDEE